MIVLAQLPHRALYFNVTFQESKLKSHMTFGKISFTECLMWRESALVAQYLSSSIAFTFDLVHD